MPEILQREAIYLWYYADLQFRQIFRYWVLGMVLGSLVSVFAKEGIHRLCARLGPFEPSPRRRPERHKPRGTGGRFLA